MKKTLKHILDAYIFPVIFAVLIALILTNYVIINAHIPSGSMLNQIQIDDRLLGNRLAYNFKSPERFDIVIFQHPIDNDKLLIKRIIGLPGETVIIKDSKIYINDDTEPLSEPYLPEPWTVMKTDMVFHVPDDSYFMLGDNRNNSEDSRYWGYDAQTLGYANYSQYSYVKKDLIVAKAIIKLFPKIAVLK